MKKVFKLIACVIVALVTNTVNAQRMGCVHGYAEEGMVTRSADDFQLLPDPFDFDPEQTYRQPVVLVTFSDTDFSMENPVAYYDRLFNEEGFNQGMGQGCVADYFRDQSNGRANIHFDIYGPIKVGEKAGGHSKSYYGYDIMHEALSKLCETEQTDFSIYDRDGNGMVNQVLFIAAGFTGGGVHQGYVWPNTGRSSFYTLPGGIECRMLSISCELWNVNSLCGIGTIIHEYLHCLGLPDIYPTASATAYSAVDEWDIMDGGNYTNMGWCPPNLSAMEKMYLGWATPVELTGSVGIRNMLPVSSGGETYIIRNSGNSNEFYLLENHCQEGWDYGCPGNGLLIFHVNYTKQAWGNNLVNVSDVQYNYDLFHADGKNYRDWNPINSGGDLNQWTMMNHLRSKFLSTSPYPFTDPTTSAVNDSLTDHSVPAATVYTANAEGKKFMGKAITNQTIIINNL